MFAVFCLLLLLGLGHCQDDLPPTSEIENSINRTIEEVERQIRADSSLPRLTRQDIVNILQNITSQDLNSLKDAETIERARKLYQRALMVVLPYSAEESSGNLRDLYSKPPMTQIIPDQTKSVKKGIGSDESEVTNDNDDNIDASSPSIAENMVATRVAHKVALKETPTTTRSQHKNHRETYSEVRTKVPLKEALKLDSMPLRFTFNLENLQKNSYTTEKTTTMTRYPVYKSNGNKDLEIIYSTSVNEQPTTKSTPKEITIDLEKAQNEQNVLTSSQWRYNPPPSTTSKPTEPSKPDRVPFLPTINAEPEDRFTVSSLKNLEVPSMDTMKVETAVSDIERPIAFYVTPMSTETYSKVKYSSTYSLNSAGFRSATTSTSSSTTMRQEVMDLLESIGLKPDNNSNVEDVYKKNKNILDSKFQIPNINSLIGATAPSEYNAPMIIEPTKFKNSESEIKKGVENLAPDVQMLFQKFGLQSAKLDEPASSTTQRTTIRLNSYTNFKPLPTSSVKDLGMKEFLARFGLGVNDNRKPKAIKPTMQTPSMIDAVPGSMRGILENIGLISSNQKIKKNAKKPAQDTESTATSKLHVFKPHEVNVDDEKQRNKINELLDTVKLVQEGRADIQNVKKVAGDLLETTKTLKDGPDPLRLEEIIRTYNEDVKNEIKRQEEQEVTTVGTVEQTTLAPVATTESTETKTDSAKAASDQLDSSSTSAPEVSSTTPTPLAALNLLALEESFGGTTNAPEPTMPPKRKSGLYFLVDWNTFLEVDDGTQKKINLRFQPKVGDRSRFLPVTVP